MQPNQMIIFTEAGALNSNVSHRPSQSLDAVSGTLCRGGHNDISITINLLSTPQNTALQKVIPEWQTSSSKLAVTV